MNAPLTYPRANALHDMSIDALSEAAEGFYNENGYEFMSMDEFICRGDVPPEHRNWAMTFIREWDLQCAYLGKLSYREMTESPLRTVRCLVEYNALNVETGELEKGVRRIIDVDADNHELPTFGHQIHRALSRVTPRSIAVTSVDLKKMMGVS